MEVTRITFQADEQNLVKTSGIDKYASHIVNYVEADFTLGTNWTGFDSVRAMWKSGNDVIATVLDGDGKCIVPHELLETRGELKVNLVGSIVEDDELTDRLTTFPIIALIVTKIAQVEGDETAPITPSQFEQYVAIVKDDADRAEDARDDAVTAKNAAELAQQKAEDAQARAESAEQAILGLTATAEIDANVGTPSVAVSVTTEDSHKVMNFDFHNLKGEQGEQGEQGIQGETGATGADGFSPVVSVEEITGGHEVTITDAQGDHSFDVMDGDIEDFYPFLPTDTANGLIANFPDGANNVPMLSLIASIDPVQDLHGQSSPYPAGGGKNLFDQSTFAWGNTGTIEYVSLPIPNGTYTFSSNMPSGSANVRDVFILAGQVTSGASSANNGVSSISPRTITVTDGYYTVASRSTYAVPKDYNFQLELGNQATTYAPYSNICPITGHTGVNVWRTGMNVWDEEWVNAKEDISTTTGEIIPAAGNYWYFRSKNYIPVQPLTTYYDMNGMVSGNYRKFFYDANKNFLSYISSASGATFTTPANCRYILFRFGSLENTVYQNNISINYPSTDHDYHAYLGNTYPISWQTEAGTVYSGTLDVVSGVLVVDMAMYTITGNEIFSLTGTGQHVISNPNLVSLGAKTFDPLQLSTAVASFTETKTYASLNVSGETSGIGIGTSFVIVGSLEYNAWQTLVGQTLCYELATPITYQLTPTEVNTLLGENNVWNDTGDTEVTYKADIQKYIDKKISAVVNA